VTSVRRLASPTLLAPLVLLVLVLVLWQAGAFHALFNLKTFTVPYPSTIASGAGSYGDELLEAILVTLPAAILGWATGMVLGLLVAILLVRYAPRAIRHVLPPLSATSSLPVVALVPVIALFLDPGLELKVIVVTIMTLPIMLVYAVRGLTSLEPTTVELMESVEASPGQLLRMVRLPTALPYLFTALKSSVVLALIGTIVAETIRSLEGLGFVIADSLSRFNAPKAWLAVIVIAAIGIVWYLVVELLERVALPWEIASRKHG
jgi:NitT/TauT family transport system permease protein